MKVLASTSAPVGAATAEAALIVDDAGNLKATVSIGLPVATVIDKATASIDATLTKLEDSIPGTWDDVLIEQFKATYKAELLKLLTE